MKERLALGTVQFGLRYGVANSTGQVGSAEAGRILEDARRTGVDTLDTAIAYGESEAVLGTAGVAGWNIVTKLPALPQDCADPAGWARAQVEASLARLGVPAVQAVLLHRPDQLLGPQGAALRGALQALKHAGLARQTGISVYSPADLEAIVPGFRPDLVQIPFNIIDGRWASTGWLDRLAASGVEIHARSVFLQGLLLMPGSRRPAWFSRWQPLWDAWETWLAASNATPLQACLRHALAVPAISRVVVGADSLAQWREIVVAAEGEPFVPPPAIAMEDPSLLNPAAWKLN